MDSLGHLIGKSATNQFRFLVTGDARKFMYVQVTHQEGYAVLALIVDVEKSKETTTAQCNIIGYRGTNGLLKTLRVPVDPDTHVYAADDDFVQNVLGLTKSARSAYIGTLEGREGLSVYLDLNKLLTRHVSILAKSGSGKSYCSGVLLEEIMERNVPVVVIDPHGEYGSLKHAGDVSDKLTHYGLDVKGYGERVVEFSPDIRKNPGARPLHLSARDLSAQELMHLLPAKLSSFQVGTLYSAFQSMGSSGDFDSVIAALSAEEGNAKWQLISVIEYVKELGIFGDMPTDLLSLVRPAQCSIINLRGVPKEVQEVIVYKIVSDLFSARKQGDIPPFFLIVEEAHNYIPERSFGEAKSSRILRQTAAEGRKFGLGMCVISQRPARVDKNVISQCSTQIILKLTNPNDLRAISNSVEGITSETEREIQNLPIGTAMVVGVVDLPLFVDIRPRMTKHGGEAVDILETFADLGGDDGREVLQVILPSLSLDDFKLRSGSSEIRTDIVPCCLLECQQGNTHFHLLVDLEKAQFVTSVDSRRGQSILNSLGPLSEQEQKVMRIACGLPSPFTPAALFTTSGLQFSELYDVVKQLQKKHYVAEVDGAYKLSDALGVFLSLHDFSCTVQPQFRALQYDRKLPEKFNISEILEFLSRFVTVVSQKPVWMVHRVAVAVDNAGRA